jgi:hypothetical protein
MVGRHPLKDELFKVNWGYLAELPSASISKEYSVTGFDLG